MFNEPIGEVLAKSRISLGKSIKEVEFDTKIRAKHIEALEADDFDTLPGSIYTQGFIKTYAGYLGIDPDPLIKSYRNRFIQPSNGDILNVSSNIRIETKKLPLWVLPTAIASGLVLLFVVLLVWGALAKSMSDEPEVVVQSIPAKQTLETAVAGTTTSTSVNKSIVNSSSTDTTEEDKPTTTTTSKKKPTTTTTKKKNEPKKDGKIDVTVKLTGINGEGSWAKVFVDGEKDYEGVVDAGESKLFKGDISVQVRIGNAPGMEVMLDGKKINTKNLDVSNGIIDHTFTEKKR